MTFICGLLALVALAVGACSAPRVTIPTPRSVPAPADSGTLRAGFGRKDITPPPGYGLFGYGPEAKPAAGYRNRLYVRSLVLQDANGELVAFAVADLDLISTLLHRKVAERVSAATGSHIAADRLLLAATHTHSAPGHYLSGAAINEFGSSVGGYDSTFANWLADGIAQAVEEAYRSRVPAKAAWAVTDVWGHTRNRSYEAYVLNSGAPALGIAAPDWLPDDLHRAVNPRWALLRVDTDPDTSGTYLPAGALSIFAIHGTGFPAGSNLYEADIHGLVARGLEEHIDVQLGGGGRHPGERRGVHLFANGAEGDVSPNWPPESRCDPATLKPIRRLGNPRTPRPKDDWEETPPQNLAACLTAAKAYVRSVGGALADTAVRLFTSLEGKLSSDLTIGRAFQTLALADSAHRLGICPKAETGAAAVAGGPDGPTRYEGWKVLGLFPLGIEAGGSAIKTSRTHCQRPKRAFLGVFQKRLVGRLAFSAYTQLAVVRVGDLLVGTVPGEASTMTGLRILSAMKAAAPAGWPVEHLAVLGLTNGDIRYIATREEYWAQYYEGGSTLYGPGTAKLLADSLAGLTASLFGPQPTVRLDTIQAEPGKPIDLWPKKGPEPSSPGLSAECVGDTVAARWFDAPPGSLVLPDTLNIAFQHLGSGKRVVDDDIDVEVRALGQRRQGYEWEARYTPLPGVRAGDRFSVTLLRPRWGGETVEAKSCPGS
ncbi:MAG: neutral/alkaline non-lysosomal ceramidase N-terminal domain-containing protein [Gemmatimonadota bacterium]|nr:MAG: neutral/alkaline non-lysosomal ceramidase N-terminal domain-containing protein [Gemmatimonadota bacterium]